MKKGRLIPIVDENRVREFSEDGTIEYRVLVVPEVLYDELYKYPNQYRRNKIRDLNWLKNIIWLHWFKFKQRGIGVYK